MAVRFVRLADIDVAGKRVFIRADLNVPLDAQGAISDDTRIRASVPAIRDALSRGDSPPPTRWRRLRAGSPRCSGGRCR